MTLARTVSGALLALGLIAAAFSTVWAQEETPAAVEGPRVVVVPAINGDEVTAAIEVRDVENLGAFQFLLIFDADRLIYERVEIGPFLEQSGREKVCPDPVAAEGAVRVSCVTLRREPAGPDGSGTLATVFFTKDGHGTAEFALDRVRLADPVATHIESTPEGGSVELPDNRNFLTRNWTWLAVGAGGLLGIVAIAGLGFAIAGRRQRPHLQPDTPQDL